MNNQLQSYSNEYLEKMIGYLQGIQKRHFSDHPAWIAASEKLAPLFDEMARRQNAGLV